MKKKIPKKELEGYKITGNKGFHLTFANGVTVSVQWGIGSYGSNHNLLDDDMFEKKWFEDAKSGFHSPVPSASTAEVAVWDKDGKWITQKCCPKHLNPDDVVGYVTPDDLYIILQRARRYK